MPQARFASDTGRAAKHDEDRTDCIPLYTALCLFTSQFMTKQGRGILKKYVDSSTENIHDPHLLARYIIAPVNEIIDPNLDALKSRKLITKESSVSSKLRWVSRHFLVSKMLHILVVAGLKPEFKHMDDYQRDFMSWIVGKKSAWGPRHRCPIVGVTQIAFLCYAEKMKNETLFKTLQDHKMTIDGKFKTPAGAVQFKKEDFGFGKENSIDKFVQNIITGKAPIKHIYAFEQFEKYLHPPPPKKRTNKAGPKRTGEDEDEELPEPEMKDVGPEVDDKTEPQVDKDVTEDNKRRTRSSDKEKTAKPDYEETSENEQESTVQDESNERAQKKPKTCHDCIILATMSAKIQEAGTTDPKDIVAELQRILNDREHRGDSPDV
jgi:hypothetical protein